MITGPFFLSEKYLFYKKIGWGYFLEDFWEIGAYFLEVVKMTMLQKSHMRQPSQGWCGGHAARSFVNSSVQGLGTA